MSTTLGAYTWSTTRGVPAAGVVTLASNPLAGVANTLRVSITDRDGNDRDAVIDTVAAGDVVRVSAAFSTGLVGTPVDNSTYWSFPFTVSTGFDGEDEPANDDEITVRSSVPGSWPSADELAQVLNIENTTDWETTIDATLAAAIATTKSNVGNWDESSDYPTESMGRAALRMAVLLSQQPSGIAAPALIRDPTYQALLTGQRRRWGIG